MNPGRVVAASLVGVLLLAGLMPRAAAMVPTDPWVPPSVASHDGLADSTLAVGGVSVPVGAGAPADVVDPAPSAVYWDCIAQVRTWGWVSGTLVVNTGAVGTQASHCAASVFASPTYGCLVVTRWWDSTPSVWREAGEVMERGVLQAGSPGVVTKGSASITVSNLVCQAGSSAVVWFVRFARVNAGGQSAADGLLTFVPGVSAAPVIAAVTHCSDGSSVSVTFLPGVAIVPAACVTGVLTGVTLEAGSRPVGNVAVHPDFQGNPCLAAAATCDLLVTWSGGSCKNTDPSCAWWGTADQATGCDWKNGAGQMWAVSPDDCEAARDDGFDVVNPLVPDPTAPPTAPSSTDTGVVEAVNDMAAAVGGAINGMKAAVVGAVNAVRDAVAGVGELVAGVPAEIGRLLLPDPGVTDGAIGRIKGAGPGADLEPWLQAGRDLVASMAPHASSDCQGPPLTVPASGHWLQGTYYPLSACTTPMSGVAIFCKVALSALTVVAGLNACIRGIIAGFDLRWDIGMYGLDGNAASVTGVVGSHTIK